MAPTPSFCAEKNRLMDAFLAASYEVIKLQNKEAVEIARSGESLAQFEVALKAARAKRDAARAACIEHIEEHGC